MQALLCTNAHTNAVPSSGLIYSIKSVKITAVMVNAAAVDLFNFTETIVVSFLSASLYFSKRGAY